MGTDRYRRFARTPTGTPAQYSREWWPIDDRTQQSVLHRDHPEVGFAEVSIGGGGGVVVVHHGRVRPSSAFVRGGLDRRLRHPRFLVRFTRDDVPPTDGRHSVRTWRPMSRWPSFDGVDVAALRRTLSAATARHSQSTR